MSIYLLEYLSIFKAQCFLGDFSLQMILPLAWSGFSESPPLSFTTFAPSSLYNHPPPQSCLSSPIIHIHLWFLSSPFKLFVDPIKCSQACGKRIFVNIKNNNSKFCFKVQDLTQTYGLTINSRRCRSALKWK